MTRFTHAPPNQWLRGAFFLGYFDGMVPLIVIVLCALFVAMIAKVYNQQLAWWNEHCAHEHRKKMELIDALTRR